MYNPKKLRLNKLLIVLVLGLVTIPAQVGAAGGYAVYESEAGFDDVLQGLKLAIEERGMYINNVMHMGEMLERTGKDLGLGEPIYTRAESIEFCSAILSREMTSRGPGADRQLPLHHQRLHPAEPGRDDLRGPSGGSPGPSGWQRRHGQDRRHAEGRGRRRGGLVASSPGDPFNPKASGHLDSVLSSTAPATHRRGPSQRSRVSG